MYEYIKWKDFGRDERINKTKGVVVMMTNLLKGNHSCACTKLNVLSHSKNKTGRVNKTQGKSMTRTSFFFFIRWKSTIVENSTSKSGRDRKE